MVTTTELEARIAEMEQAQAVSEALIEISRVVNVARDEEEILHALARPALETGAASVILNYIDLDESGEPEWSESVAGWEREGEPSILVGTRFYLADWPLLRLWMSSPDEPLFISDISTDGRLDDGIKNILAQEGWRSVLILPLTHSGRWVGNCSCSWDEPHAFSERVKAIYRGLIGLVSPAIENRRLLAQTRQALAERKEAEAERERLHQEIIEAQKQTLQELSTPVIPIMERVIVMPLIGSIDSMRARDITRALLAGIRKHRAKVVILDITGVPLVDSGVASHLNKTIQAARLKGASTIVTGISDAVAETIVDLGIDWEGVETVSDLQTGLRVALDRMGLRIMV